MGLGPEDNGEAERTRMQLKRLIAEWLAFDSRTDASRRRPSTLAMVERVCAMQRAGEFSGALDELWSEASEHVEELIAQSAELGTFEVPEAKLSKHVGFKWPVQDPRARIESWATV